MRNVMEGMAAAIRKIKLYGWDYSATLTKGVGSTAVFLSKIGTPQNITMINRIKTENHKRMLKYAKLKSNNE